MDKQVLFEKYYARALRFLARRPRSEKEVKQNLLKPPKGKKESPLPIEVADQIVSLLREQRFVNDEEFASWWIRQRAEFRPKGKRIIQMELKQKGIRDDIIEKAFSLNQEEEKPLNDLESAKALVAKRLPRYHGLERQELYQKLGGFLARRGYDWETIKKAIDESLI